MPREEFEHGGAEGGTRKKENEARVLLDWRSVCIGLYAGCRSSAQQTSGAARETGCEEGVDEENEMDAERARDEYGAGEWQGV